ncbi:MAG: exodeoxyribonuclease VII small subunit [Proteobacteria bacterium]|nr:exodeoxyribonuclease VII small subunit [Pseudomonadota bacterium]NDC23315.1 exodeoxyribonuclease VII small subunit [Pseudomonadota bacterium]NDD03444.1 exodeoxyribonuclease VII small subunit [Pseudomonadota bacterium]NDG26145.1 exodeoxyribonuclease VII small subunit [Pseudomonadota bacterium]
MSNSKEKSSFETSLKELEKIVGELEAGEIPLETQLKSFEKGVALSRECLRQLEEVERKVELLMQTGDGEIKTAPFDAQSHNPG